MQAYILNGCLPIPGIAWIKGPFYPAIHQELILIIKLMLKNPSINLITQISREITRLNLSV